MSQERFAITLANVLMAMALFLAGAMPGHAQDADKGKSKDAFPLAFAGSASFMTNYVDQGVSQTNGRPAMQVTLEATLDLQSVTPYANVFGSNVDLPTTSTELDWSGGLRWSMVGLNWDTNAKYNTNPGADPSLNTSFWEYTLQLNRDFGSFNPTVALTYAPSNVGKSGPGWYLTGNVDIPLPIMDDLKLTLHAGRQWVHDPVRAGLPDYNDWSVGVSKQAFGLVWALTYTDTNLSVRDCGGSNACDARVVFSVTKNF